MNLVFAPYENVVEVKFFRNVLQLANLEQFAKKSVTYEDLIEHLTAFSECHLVKYVGFDHQSVAEVRIKKFNSSRHII